MQRATSGSEADMHLQDNIPYLFAMWDLKLDDLKESLYSC